MEFPGVPSDTSDAIERRVTEGLRGKGAAGRLALTMALGRAATELAVAGIRLREGVLDAAELRRRLASLRHDAVVVARVEAYRAGRDR